MLCSAPMAFAPRPGGAADPAEVPGGIRTPRPRMLVVDDVESVRVLLAMMLSRHLGAEPVLAGTCEEALRLSGSTPYDCILLDLLMPGIGGVEVLRRVRTESPNARTPVVVVSAVSDQASMDRCLALGASAYITKPIERHSLISAVSAQIRAHPPQSPQVTND